MKLDIAQMNYLISIVEANCNLSLAAKQIHVTQSALSQFISNFEKDEGVQLFRRKNGRLVELTTMGQKIYESSLEILSKHDALEEMVQRESKLRKGSIRVGMPSIILRTLFTKFFPHFMLMNPDINVEIVEEDGKTLREMLLDNDLHYAILVEPTLLDPDLFDQHVLGFSEIAAFMNPNHPLANKQSLSWRDIDNYHITLLSEGFEAHHLVMEKLKQVHSKSNILMTSASWDYLVESCAIHEIISLLPTARFSRYFEHLKKMGVVEKRFNDPIAYTPMICRPIKKKYTQTELFVYEAIVNGFYKITRGGD